MFLVLKRIDTRHRTWRQLPTETLEETVRHLTDSVTSEFKHSGYSTLDLPRMTATILDTRTNETHQCQLVIPDLPQTSSSGYVTGMPQLRSRMVSPPQG